MICVAYLISKLIKWSCFKTSLYSFYWIHALTLEYSFFLKIAFNTIRVYVCVVFSRISPQSKMSLSIFVLNLLNDDWRFKQQVWLTSQLVANGDEMRKWPLPSRNTKLRFSHQFLESITSYALIRGNVL